MRGTGFLLSGPDGLCRLGNQRERMAGGRQGEERKGEWSLMLQLGILSSFPEGLMDMSAFLVFPLLQFSHLIPLVSLMTQFITLKPALC